MYLLYRAAFTLYDFRGDDPRKRKDELLCALNREYAAGDIAQIQFSAGIWYGSKQVANIADD